MIGEGVSLCYVEPNFYGCRHGSTPTHLAIPLDESSLAGLRERVQGAVSLAMSGSLLGTHERAIADAVLAALGLEPA